MSDTNKFVQERLKEARDARGVSTLITLAGLLNVNTSSVSRWEDGRSDPTTQNLLDLASKLNLRPSYFYRPMYDHGNSPVFFRSLASARKRDLARQRARLRWLQEVSIVVQHYVKLPDVKLPTLPNGESYRALRDDDIERLADDLRKLWDLGDRPIANVIDIMERNGFVVGADEMGTTTLDGLCNWSDLDRRPYVMLAKDKMSFFRRQMDAAHEMAHAILHRHVTNEDLRRDFDLIEQQAFRLASAFLMPSNSFSLAARLPTLSGLLMLKDRWHVSVKAMIRRCRDLELISRADETQLYKYYSAKGWSREEPLDRLAPIARPRLLAQAISLIVEQGGRSKDELLANEFIIPARDIENLVCLDEGWFAKKTGQVITLRPVETDRRADAFEVSEVLAFTGPTSTRR